MYTGILCYLAFVGLIGNIDVLFCHGQFGVFLSSYLPWNRA